MKAAVFHISLVLMLSISTSSQLFSQPISSVPIEIGFFPEDPSENPRKYAGTPATVIFETKDPEGNVLHKETHEAILDQLSFLRIFIGTGTPDPGNPHTAQELPGLSIESLCYTITLHTPEGDITIMDVSDAVSDYNSYVSVRSEQAQNAKALGGNEWKGLPISGTDFVDFTTTPGNVSLPVLNNGFVDPENNGLYFMNVGDFFTRREGPSAVTGNTLPYFNAGLGTQCVIVHGIQALLEIESYETWCTGSMQEFYNGFAFKVPQAAHPPLDHSTAAVYAENRYDPMGVGLFSYGAARGSYNQGQSGMLGLTIGVNNGAGSWSRVAQAPSTGGFKYGALVEDQGLADSWALAMFGDGFYTGTWMQSSDRRLKTEIRSQTNGLKEIMKLRPSQYQYVQNTHYGLPDGTHHGFIAQEMEEVLPDLVSDITMPTKTGPDEIGNSETVQYKAINYIELIPILTSAIQELKTQLDAQATEITALKKELMACKPK